MKELTFKILLTDEEITLLKNTDWSNKEIQWDERYNSLIRKGILYEDFAFNMFLTYGFTEIGEMIKDSI